MSVSFEWLADPSVEVPEWTHRDSFDPTASNFGRASQAYADLWASIFGLTKPNGTRRPVEVPAEDLVCGPARYELQLGAPNLGSDRTHDWFIPDPSADGR